MGTATGLPVTAVVGRGRATGSESFDSTTRTTVMLTMIAAAATPAAAAIHRRRVRRSRSPKRWSTRASNPVGGSASGASCGITSAASVSSAT